MFIQNTQAVIRLSENIYPMFEELLETVRSWQGSPCVYSIMMSIKINKVHNAEKVQNILIHIHAEST